MTDSSPDLFDIVFRGDILPGQQLLDVKKRLQQLFKADEQKINALFAGGVVPLKRNLEKSAAERYLAALRQAGADVQLAPAGKVTARAAQRPARRRSSAQEQAPEKPATMAERLAAQEADAQEADAQEAERKREELRLKQSAVARGLTLAPAGTDLLEASEKSQEVELELDLSGYSLREEGGRLVDSTEIERPAEVLVTDLEVGVSEAGADLLSEEERYSPPLPEVSVPDVDLAPAGSDMGQLKADLPPLNPDISGLELE